MDLRITLVNGPYVVALRDLTRADVSRVGAKAANLGELARAGYPVPDGFALTTQAFDRFSSSMGSTKPTRPRKCGGPGCLMTSRRRCAPCLTTWMAPCWPCARKRD